MIILNQLIFWSLCSLVRTFWRFIRGRWTWCGGLIWRRLLRRWVVLLGLNLRYGYSTHFLLYYSKWNSCASWVAYLAYQLKLLIWSTNLTCALIFHMELMWIKMAYFLLCYIFACSWSVLSIYYLQAVCTEAGMFALRERRVHVTQEDFEMAVAKVMKKETEKNMSLRKLWK